ncbi:unnamed protein product [Phyllotreta striolata]|uniref:KASH domain-containing protein n=1 Tax=Phyllotreta striolata TaxID=444603 RepID=A0A9P0DWR1_PHYSR|nr:unnamed protein product [Phyllotreta striolata]
MDVVKIPNAIGHKPNGMTKTPNFVPDEKKINLDFINCNLPEDTSHYTISDKKSPKLATYYFKHEETENNMENDINHTETLSLDNQTDDQEKNQQAKDHAEEIDAQKQNVNPILRPFGNSRSARPKSLSDDRIRILVQQAEELVSDKRHIGKLSKVNKWLKLEKPDDSCDASGEDDEKESQASDDLDTSSATLRGTDNSTSQNSIQDLDLHLNGKKWLSSGSRLNRTSTGMNNFSISESALHQMILPLKGFPASFSAVSSNNINVNSNNSTSSTVEEVLPLIAEKISPVRKKKSKLKKRPLVGKSDTHLLYNGGCKNRSHLIKSGSFPGYSTKTTNGNTNVEQETFTGHTYYAGHSETSTTSGGDSEEDIHKSRPANFKYGGRTRYLHHEASRDNKFGKNVIPTEEQSSSLSEQAWDNYQENYLSEPYSESHDSDAARRLLNFGEDYRKFIDSQSDWSAFSDISPRMKRKSWPQPNDEDSNSDEESLKQLINDSRDQLRYAEDVYEQLKLGVHEQLVTSEIDDLITTCERHIALLKHINESSYEYKMSFVDKAVTADLLDQWRVLKSRSSYMDEYRRLRKQISDLKSFIELQNISERKLHSPQPCGIDDIYNEIDNCNKILDSLSQQSGNLASINALVHRYTLDNQDCEEFNGTALKGEISELYEMFDNARTCVTEELSQLKTLLPVWRILESRLDQLQIDLKMDEKLMETIDYSLTNGMFTDQTVASVREVAKLLSETNNSSAHHNSEVVTEGSYSDSGISDEGSEQEIGERQRRLAAIRRLVRQLETGLSSDSRARLMMREKLRATEDELKALQLRCRSLISRTSACSDRLRPASEQEVSKPEDSKVKVASGDPDSDPGKSPKAKSWFKRFFKASVTFQLVLLAFVCLSCILEPSCCDYMNNYSWTLTPKLHYEARPPI